MKLSAFIMAIIVAVLFMGGFALVMSDMNTKNPLPASYNYSATTMQSFDKMKELENISSDIKDRMNQSTKDRSLTDVVGNLVLDGLDTMKLATKSFDVFQSIAASGFEYLHLPGIFSAAFMTILIVAIFLGIVVAAIIGREV
jgi:hypothetical protein